ncbi:SDR family NAD(P)-dependent oxidoreductase [Steroidobacter sp.]|uniref:SDR family NAD(P)-dependent oxidoreductase n=1 Tax=Steroidobacter sp. TaxID=1978227 RepID=UPI001A42FB20|nr:SDR family NAD(P)-dependent oxidoreductase [Steroidobacter sp.]MBL8265220.1 SDR family oxidoreductase [Steroidobacter sp.]
MSTNSAALAGKHALVTGASRGIGVAIAQRLLDEGARVTLLGRHLPKVLEVATKLSESNAYAVAADVSNSDQLYAAVQDASNRFGPIDILINNAGQASSAPLHKTDEALWQAMLAVNLTGTFNGIRHVLPSMLQRNFGRIVNVASTAGLKGYPYVAAYSAAKHGVIGLTRSLALEVAGRNITVNAVCPGYTDTDLIRETISNIQAKTSRSESEALAALVASNPQRRLIRCEEVANAVAWLCVPGSESVTGQSIAVAGGEVM